ncbi:NUDIX hydrolase [Catalinimonas alkaloidigena]|uniref:NUDIX hydrolase n=1 Tax=Catalinimonas alkaloidigena TaxID=1075417 RepID=UPI000B7D7DD3|nr:NUDIX domain-containing protein [Catalinimonas alkaloidigena]
MTQDTDPLLYDGHKRYHPGLSVDCVIFGFHDNQLKVLLLKMSHTDQRWALPGGFVLKDEDVESAAHHVLQSRTGLDNIFLRQFYLFGEVERSDRELNRKMLQGRGVDPHEDHWLLQRFITIGYYALVDFTKALPRPDELSDACDWWDFHNLPPLMMDHARILQKALEALRQQLNREPIGYNLLPEKFTMPELQKLYETILGKTLDRRNFQRKMLAYGILERLNERRSGGAHKAPYLYRFDLASYHKALEEGFSGGW